MCGEKSSSIPSIQRDALGHSVAHVFWAVGWSSWRVSPPVTQVFLLSIQQLPSWVGLHFNPMVLPLWGNSSPCLLMVGQITWCRTEVLSPIVDVVFRSITISYLVALLCWVDNIRHLVHKQEKAGEFKGGKMTVTVSWSGKSCQHTS